MKARKTVRVERYAGMLARLEDKLEERLQRWANLLQLQSDKLTWRQKYIVFMIFCIGVSVVCASIIFNAFK